MDNRGKNELYESIRTTYKKQMNIQQKEADGPNKILYFQGDEDTCCDDVSSDTV